MNQSVQCRKEQRVRDPVHGLICFSASNDFEQLIWRLINAPEFQRLRRIKQLGFSELVYPGASHTRFAHSVGVFHAARELVSLMEKHLGSEFDQDKAHIATCAALLHDLGHGPFSHTFEGVEKSRGVSKKHEQWTADIIRGDTEIGRLLEEFSAELRRDVAELLEKESPTDIYSSIVSSQFDADRIDYLRRDKLMTGTEHGGFDWLWLLNNLEIESITIGGDAETDPLEVRGLILSYKGLKAAEGYLLGRYHLYTQVYMHKTTRGAEKLLGKLLSYIAGKIANDDAELTGLSCKHPLIQYFATDGGTVRNYLLLDDTTIWGALPLLETSQDAVISELAERLRNRRFYKCLDIGARAKQIGSDVTPRFQKALSASLEDGTFSSVDVLQDRATVSAYKFREYESPDALTKVTIRLPDGTGNHEDVARLSPVIGALGEEKIYRVYARNDDTMEKLVNLWNAVRRRET